MPFLPPAENLDAVPLASLPAVVMDTETTGLDVENDRVVEIGAVAVDGERVLEESTFSSLVDPGIPIPEQSRNIHGIADGDVAGSPGFAEAMGAFAKFAGDRLVLGFSIGFDMGILKAEHARHQMPWVAPRHLDVAHLARILRPELPYLSLELVSDWLGVDVVDRHRALGDALVTAKAFVSLVLLLREKGISTFAQARRACLQLSDRMIREIDAGWLVPEGGTESAAQAASRARVDSFQYRHRVSDVMSPALKVPAETTVAEASRMMIERQVSSLFVCRDGAAAGIVTERDMLRFLAEGKEDPQARDLSFAVKPSLISVSSDEFVYRALLRMDGSDVRHLAVTDAAGNVVGAITPRNLLAARAGEATRLGERIERATSAGELGKVWQDLIAVVRTLAEEKADARDIAAIVSRELRELTRRACRLAENELSEEGAGDPPVPYAMLVLGSGGRGESLLAMDQDNAIVFAEGEPDGEADRWFARLGSRVSDMLNTAGLAYCKGGVMASNSAWRKSRERWLATVEQWLLRSKPADMLNCDIFFDAVPAHGDAQLAADLLSRSRLLAQQADKFLNFLALESARVDSPLGMLGKIKTKDGRIDLKMHGLLPVFSAARVLALRNGIGALSTVSRLREFRERGGASGRIVDGLVQAHEICLDLILRQQLRDAREGLPLGSRVDVAALSSYDKESLRWALKQIPDIQALLGTPPSI